MEKDDKRRFTDILPELVERLNPKEILPYLTCLSSPSREVIRNRQEYNNSLTAVLELHEHLSRHPKGFQELVFGLRELGLKDIADRLTPVKGRDGEIKHEKLLKSRESRKQLTYNSDTVIRDINVGFLDILKHLDYSGNQRWEQLAGHLGYNYSEYKMIAHEAKINAKSPTVVLLDHNMDLTLGKLFAILKYEMERTDVVELLENFTGFRLPEKDNEEGIGNQQTDEMSEKENDGIQAERRQISERQDRGVEVLYNRKDQQKLAVNERTIMSDSQRNENIFQSLAHPVETLHEPLGQPKESNEVTDISSLNLAKEGKHMLAGMVEDIELCNEHTKIIDLSLEENRLHAVETSVNDQNTKLTVDTCGIPVDGSEPNLSRQMLFPQQECEKPGPYLPVTGSASSSDLSQEKFFREFSVQSQEASEDPSAVDHVVEPCDSSLISLGHAYSIHHHEGQTVDDCQDTNDEMLSNSEERADILRKAQKPIPKVADLDFDKVEFEHDRVDDTGLRHNTNSVSDTGSYEIPSSIVLPPDLNEETSQQKFHLGSPLFRRRASGVSQELSDKITDCTNNNDHALRLSEAVQESASPRASARGEIDSDNEYRTGGFFVSHDRDEDDVDNSKSSFPWMHSLIVVGTAAVATLAYKSLKG